MKKYIVTALVAIVVSPIFAGIVAPRAPAVDPRVKNFLNGRRICVKRDTSTKPGYVIAYWERNGRPDWKLPAVTTNLIHAVHGAEQLNPLQADAEKTKNVRSAKKNAAKKDAKNLEKLIDDVKKARDKSSAAMRDLYDSILVILEEST